MNFKANSPTSYNALGVARLGHKTYLDLYYTAKRLTADEAVLKGVITKALPADTINEEVSKFALDIQKINTDSRAYGITKEDVYQDVLDSLYNNPGANEYCVKQIFSSKEIIAKL